MKRLISFTLALLMVVGLCLVPPAAQAAEVSSAGYYYSQLEPDSASQKVYDLLAEMRDNGKLKTGTHTVDLVAKGVLENKSYEKDSLMAAFSAGRDAFMLDNAALFYVDFDKLTVSMSQAGSKYSYTMGIGRDATYFRTGFDSTNVDKAIADFDAKVSAIAASVQADASRYDKVSAAFEAVKAATEYALEKDAKAENINYVRTPYGALVRGQSVCEGYARALKAVLDQMGIESVLVQGYYDADPIPGPHMWNYVRMDDNRWYLVDATMSDGEGYNQHLLLPGPHELVAPYQADGAISLTEDAKVFNYPTLSPIDYQKLSQAFVVTNGSSGAIISYEDKGILANKEAGNYLLCSYNGSIWYYLENSIKNTAWGQQHVDHPDQYDLAARGVDTPEGFHNYFNYPYLAVTKTPPPTAPAVYTVDDVPAYCAFNLSNKMFDIQQFGQAVELRKTPPYVVSRTPESSFVDGGQTLEVTVVYSERLTLQDFLVEPSIKLATTDTGSSVTDFNWEKNSNTITFTLHVGESFGYTINYFVYPQNLKGAVSGEVPDAVAFTRMNLHKFSCPKVPGDINNIHSSVPALIADSDLSLDQWTDENGDSLGQNLPNQLALVASPLPETTSEGDGIGSADLLDKVETTSGKEVLGAQTFDISLSLCSGQVSYIQGKRVKVYVPFPAGYNADSNVTFKAYHYNKKTNTVDQIDCVVAEGGIIMMCDAFSPFAVVAMEKEAVTEKSVITHADGNGSFGDVEIIKVAQGQTETVTVTAKEGYRIEDVKLNGNSILNRKLRTTGDTTAITLDYDALEESGNTLEATFTLKNVEVEGAEELSVTIDTPNEDITVSAPESGWHEGMNSFTVTAAQPCIVVASHEDGAAYTRLTAVATGAENTWSVSASMTEGSQIKVLLAGDADLNGTVDAADVDALKQFCLSGDAAGSLEAIVYDLNADGRINILDVVAIRAHLLGKKALSWTPAR